MRRRDFLGRASLILGSGAIFPGCTGDRASQSASISTAQEPGSPDPLLASVGVQLYTLRTLMAEDVHGTLRAVADLGYQEVEFAGLFGFEAQTIREWLDEVGLNAPAAHLSPLELTDGLEQTVHDASDLGLRWVVLPWVPAETRSVEGYRETAKLLNDVGGRTADQGIRVAYHNHDFEFEDLGGTTGLDILLEETDPDLVDFEVDFFWLAEGGRSAESLFEAHPGRFALCHAKDRTRDGGMVAVGAGNLDWPALFAMSEQAGLRHTFVEHDDPDDPLGSIEQSLTYLQSA